MSPYEQIDRKYREHPKELSLEGYVDWHLRFGFVFSRPDFFAMGRPIVRARAKEMTQELIRAHGSEADAWYIHAAAGNMARMWQVVPWPLPWICWSRVADPLSTLTFVETDRLKRLCPPDLVSV